MEEAKKEELAFEIKVRRGEEIVKCIKKHITTDKGKFYGLYFNGNEDDVFFESDIEEHVFNFLLSRKIEISKAGQFLYTEDEDDSLLNSLAIKVMENNTKNPITEEETAASGKDLAATIKTKLRIETSEELMLHAYIDLYAAAKRSNNNQYIMYYTGRMENNIVRTLKHCDKYVFGKCSFSAHTFSDAVRWLSQHEKAVEKYYEKYYSTEN